MRRGIGAILSTGVALVGAAVVVANPVMAPSSDVRVPAVELSAGAGASAGMLDQSFLNAIAQDPADPALVSNFKRLLAQLVTDAALFGGKAVEEAFQAQDVLVVPPALTAASVPYLLPAAIPGDRFPAMNFSTPLDPVAVAAEVGPVLRQSITTLANDAGYVGGQVVAAVAAGVFVETEPKLIIDTLTALATGDLKTALDTALQAVAAPFGPPLLIANAIRTLRPKGSGELTVPLAVAAQPAPAPVASLAALPRPVSAAPARRSTATLRAAAAESTETVLSANGAADLSTGNKVTPGSVARPERLGDKITAVVDSARTTVGQFADAARTAVGARAHAGADASSDN